MHNPWQTAKSPLLRARAYSSYFYIQPLCYLCLCVCVCVFFLFGFRRSMWKYWGQGWSPHHGSDLRHSGDNNVRSLIRGATTGTPNNRATWILRGEQAYSVCTHHNQHRQSATEKQQNLKHGSHWGRDDR